MARAHLTIWGGSGGDAEGLSAGTPITAGPSGPTVYTGRPVRGSLAATSNGVAMAEGTEIVTMKEIVRRRKSTAMKNLFNNQLHQKCRWTSMAELHVAVNRLAEKNRNECLLL